MYRNLTTKLGVRDDRSFILAGTQCDLILVHQIDCNVPACQVYYLAHAVDDGSGGTYCFLGNRPGTLMTTAGNNAVISRIKKNRTLSIACYWGIGNV